MVQASQTHPPGTLSPDERDMIAGLLGQALPATTGLLVSFGESIRDRREHEHPDREDWFCLNLSAYMGERMAPVLRRLVDIDAENEQLRARIGEAVATVARLEQKRVELERIANAERARVAELEAGPVAYFHASHESIVFGRYRNKDAARLHCDTLMLREQPTAVLDWIEDEEDGVDELVATVDGKEIVTGYVVTASTIASEYDAEADE